MYRTALLASSLLLTSSVPAQTPASLSGTTVSSFRAEVRGHVHSGASGEAEFGAVLSPDQPAPTFVISLGSRGDHHALLFTRSGGGPLTVGSYRISDEANGENEILALLLTGSSTRPTGAFRGSSGWLVVTSISGRLITGRFQLDATGFLTNEPRREDRQVTVTGSFSATPAAVTGSR
jgi:hypothetical protein